MGTRLYVGNLPYDASDAQIRAFFEQGGARQVSQVKIITDRETGRPRGFAFVELTDVKMADSAIAELHGTQFGGRTIVVNKAHQPRHGSGGDGAAPERSDRSEPRSTRDDRDYEAGNERGNDRGSYGRGRR
jgi:RNA recognition motif-containing protein